MIVRRIDARNFRLLRDASLVTREGGFVVSGQNGSGKSSWIYALRFGLYGSVPEYTIGDLLTWGETDGHVVVYLEVLGKPYRVTRQFNSKTTHLTLENYDYATKEWHNIGANLTSATQAVLDEILRIPPAVFDEIVIKQQGDFGSLTETTPAGRYKIFKELADVEHWEKYGKKVEEILDGLWEDISKLNESITLSERTIEQTELRPVDPEEISALETVRQENANQLEFLKTQLSETQEYVRQANAYQDAQTTIERYKDAKEWNERWQKVKDIPKPTVAYSEDELKRVKDEIDRLRKLTEDLPAKIDESRSGAERDMETLDTLRKERDDARQRRHEAQLENSKINHQISTLEKETNLISSGKCPTCERAFRSVEDRVAHIQKEIEALRQQILPFDEIDAELKSIDTKIQSVEGRIRTASAEAKKLEDRLKQYNSSIESHTQRMTALEASKAATDLYAEKEVFLKEYPYSGVSPEEAYRRLVAAEAVKAPQGKKWGEVGEIQQEITEVERDMQDAVVSIHLLKETDKNYRYHSAVIKEAKEKLALIKPEAKILEDLKMVYSKNGAPRKVVERWIRVVEREANRQLERLTHGKFSIRFVSKTDTGRDTIELAILDNESGSERKFKTLSGGERTRVNVALALAMSNSFSDLTGIPLETIWFDEVYGLDEAGQQEYADIIREVAREKAIVVATSCFESMTLYFEEVFKMQKGSLAVS